MTKGIITHALEEGPDSIYKLLWGLGPGLILYIHSTTCSFYLLSRWQTFALRPRVRSLMVLFKLDESFELFLYSSPALLCSPLDQDRSVLIALFWWSKARPTTLLSLPSATGFRIQGTLLHVTCIDIYDLKLLSWVSKGSFRSYSTHTPSHDEEISKISTRNAWDLSPFSTLVSSHFPFNMISPSVLL